MVMRLLVAGFLLAHAAIHLGFVTPAPAATAGGPPWPFATDHSWLFGRFGVGPAGTRVVGNVLVAVTLIAFTVAGVAGLGLVPAGLWAPALTVGATASLGLLIAFFHPWLVLGVAIDVGLLWGALIAGWAPASASLTGP
ncbi:MAG: hypothetical protein ACJ765_02395 [Chloroflexota bacterium]